MSARRYLRHAAVALAAALVAVSIGLVAKGGNAHGDTTSGTLVGEGGDAMTPVMRSLLKDDTAQLNPDTASYTNVNLDQGISDFVGTAPGSFATDFAVTERPLNTAENAMATTNGRSYAYVPFAATPIALMTQVPNASFSNSTGTISPSDYCQHIQLSLAQLDGLYGSPAFTNWGAGSMTCEASSPGATTTTTTAGGSTTTTSTTGAAATGLDPIPIALYGNADPTMENFGLITLLDSTDPSKATYQAELNALTTENLTNTQSTAPTESWPYSTTAVPGGDEAVLGKVVGLNARTGAPSNETAMLQLGAILPVASVWTGAPLGVQWNLPTAAVQNAQLSYVAPSTTSAAAAEADATLASTSDPTTNNLVTFNSSTTDAQAYNSDLMMESYLVVPTNGLPSDKAVALAQFIRFALGTEGEKDISALGAAPATPAMVTAGLQVAQQLDVEAATTASVTAAECATTTTTTAAGSSTSTTSTTAPTTTTTPSSTTTTTSPTSGSTTTTTVPCSTTTTTSGTTTGSTTPTSVVCTPTATTTTTVAPTTSTTSTSPTTSTSTTSTSPSTSTTTSTTSPDSTTTSTTSDSTTTTSTVPDSTTTSTVPDSTTTSTSADNETDESTTTSTDDTADNSTTTSTVPNSTTTSTSSSTTTSTSPSTTTTTAPSTTTTTDCPTTTATTTISTGDGSGDGGSPSSLAFTGSNPVPLVGLGFLLFILGEVGLRVLRKRLGRG
jgi:hypothetical protein